MFSDMCGRGNIELAKSMENKSSASLYENIKQNEIK